MLAKLNFLLHYSGSFPINLLVERREGEKRDADGGVAAALSRATGQGVGRTVTTTECGWEG